MSRRAYERTLAEILCARDPGVALARALAVADGPLLEWLRAIDVDGLRMSALLVARLRFERLVAGGYTDAYESDPVAFTEAFARYHSTVPPRAFTPGAEARSFARFLRAG